MLCVICNKKYTSVSSLRTHYSSTIHKINLEKTNSNNLLINTNESFISNSTNNYNLENNTIDNIITDNNVQFTQSTQSIQNTNPTNSITTMSTVDNNQIIESHNLQKIECPGCGKQYAHKTNLYRHRNNCYFYKEAYKISSKTQIDIKLAAKLLKQQNLAKLLNIK